MVIIVIVVIVVVVDVVVVAVFLAVGIVIHIIEVVVVEVVVVEVVSSNCRSSINQVCMIMVAVRVQMEEEGWMWVHGRWVWAPGERISKMRFREERPFLPWAHAGQRERERGPMLSSPFACISPSRPCPSCRCPCMPIDPWVRLVAPAFAPHSHTWEAWSDPSLSQDVPSKSTSLLLLLAQTPLHPFQKQHHPTRGPHRALGTVMANNSSTQNKQFCGLTSSPAFFFAVVFAPVSVQTKRQTYRENKSTSALCLSKSGLGHKHIVKYSPRTRRGASRHCIMCQFLICVPVLYLCDVSCDVCVFCTVYRYLDG